MADKNDITLDQDCILKTTVFVCTSPTVCLKATVRECSTCTDVSWLTTCMNFKTPPLSLSRRLHNLMQDSRV